MTYTEVYSDYLSHCYPLEYSGTSLSTDDMISSIFRWDPPTALPTTYVQKPVSRVIEPHIDTRSCKHFRGHKFRLGGSKK